MGLLIHRSDCGYFVNVPLYDGASSRSATPFWTLLPCPIFYIPQLYIWGWIHIWGTIFLFRNSTHGGRTFGQAQKFTYGGGFACAHALPTGVNKFADFLPVPYAGKNQKSDLIQYFKSLSEKLEKPWIQMPESKLQNPDCRVQSPDSRFQIPESRI